QTHQPPPRPPLFPYTTLFRSARPAPGRPEFEDHHAALVLDQLVFAAVQQIELENEPRLADQRGLRPGEAAIAGRVRLILGEFGRSEEHTSELQSPCNLVCRLL